jgi:hypothetical protein
MNPPWTCDAESCQNSPWASVAAQGQTHLSSLASQWHTPVTPCNFASATPPPVFYRPAGRPICSPDKEFRKYCLFPGKSSAMNTIQFITDTATLCVFDIQSLKHRLSDDCDWWSLPEEELREVNAGNVAFIGLGIDGKFTLSLSEQLDSVGTHEIHLKCPSGRVFIGAGEEVTGDGLEPDCTRGGTFLTVSPGNYLLRIKRVAQSALSLVLVPDSSTGVNAFTEQVRV